MYSYKKIKRKDGTTIDEHRLLMAEKLAEPGLIVHHIDGDKRNNAPDNLAVMTRAEHACLHGFGTAIRSPTQQPLVVPDEDGMFVCPYCGTRKPVSEFVKHSRRPYGFDSECKKCHAKRIRKRRAVK
jgi:hypothetical protein